MEAQQRQIAILGSTGSIGTQTLDIIRSNPAMLRVHTLVAGRNYALLIEQALEFRPSYVLIAVEEHYNAVSEALQHIDMEVLCGSEAICDLVRHPEVDIVITAMVGFSGLRPTIAAIEAGKTIGLANKETLVVGGELIMPLARKHSARIIPVDSEHSAIYQCLIGETTSPEKLYLTASGGPFRTFSKEDLQHVTRAQALRHPNWSMGAKVTIDSSSLMNKGLEMIEAHWLFDCPAERIEVIVHPQSIIHSMVLFRDGSVKAQLGQPDMRLPIGYALGLTERIANDYPRYDFFSQGFSFEPADTERFPNLTLAYEAIGRGGSAPCALNAANEVAVEAFLSERIPFLAMSQLNEAVLQTAPFVSTPTLDDLFEVDSIARILATEMLPKFVY